MAKSSRKLSGAYLDTKGTLIAYYDELRDGRKMGETVDVHYGYCKLWIAPLENRHTMYGAPGRIILPSWGNSSVLKLAKGGRFECRQAGIENGSENTKNAGIAIQYVQLRLANQETLTWHDIPRMMSPTFTIQQGDEYIKPADLRAGQYLEGIERILINKVTGTHPDAAAKPEVA